MIKCKCDNCIHQRGDGYCRRECISVTWYGGCDDMKPATVCGMCRKFGTRDCKFYRLVEADEAAPTVCFEPKITFVNTEDAE